MCKPFRTVFSDREYKTGVRALGDDYHRDVSRRVRGGLAADGGTAQTRSAE